MSANSSGGGGVKALADASAENASFYFDVLPLECNRMIMHYLRPYSDFLVIDGNFGPIS